MHEAHPSRTALRVALRRAAHQVHDAHPLVFEDPLAVRILGPEFRAELERTPDSLRRPYSASLRAFVVARARIAEDALAEAYEQGVRQYIVLGAGLDTFAYRHVYPGLRVFEVDHPATQAWKRGMVAAAGITEPASLHFAPVDFECESVREALARSAFDFAAPAVTAWLGVVPYLTMEAFSSTLEALGSLPSGSRLIFDYAIPREDLPPREQQMRDSIAQRARQAGEPFRLFLSPEAVRTHLSSAGMSVQRDWDTEVLTNELFSSRPDHLRPLGSAARVCDAVIAGEV